jgi:hypothetical protein
MEIILGTIQDFTPYGEITIKAKYDNIERFCKRKYDKVEIGLNDGRTISLQQRKTIYALIGAIADYSGDMPEGMKNLMKMNFLTKQYNGLAKTMFSLADCDMTLACDFTKYLLEFCLDFAVPLKFDVLEFLDKDSDMLKLWAYSCLKHKMCTVCGKRGELHHIDQIGMGNDRTQMVHEGLEAMCLCRKHHEEWHTVGQAKFDEKYHLNGGVKLDKDLCKIYKLKFKEK